MLLYGKVMEEDHAIRHDIIVAKYHTATIL